MRSLLILTIAFGLAANTVTAQKLTFGPKIGANLIPLEFTEVQGQGYALGWHGGAFLDVAISKRFSVQPEILYTTKRKNYSDSETDDLLDNDLMSGLLGDSIGLFGLENFINTSVNTEIKGSVSLSYIEIPVPVIFKPTKTISITAGPYVGILSGARAVESSITTIPLLDAFALDSTPEAAFVLNFLFPDRDQEVITESSSTSKYAGFNWGFVAGVGYEPARNIRLELRYTRGLVDYRFGAEEVLKNTHVAMQFSIAYRFSAAAFKAPSANEPSIE